MAKIQYRISGGFRSSKQVKNSIIQFWFFSEREIIWRRREEEDDGRSREESLYPQEKTRAQKFAFRFSLLCASKLPRSSADDATRATSPGAGKFLTNKKSITPTRPPSSTAAPAAAHQLRPTRLFLFSVLSRPCRRVFSSPNHLAISSHQVGPFSLLLQHYYQLNGTVEIDGHAIIAMIRSPPLPSSTLYIRSTAYYSSRHPLAHHDRRRPQRRQALKCSDCCECSSFI